MRVETITLNESRNVTLTAYLQEVGGEFHHIPKRPAVLVLPGGGYYMCSDREADPVALAFLRAGFQTFVLRYSVGSGVTWPMPLEDHKQAMATIRERAEEWNLYPDKVAVVGFSAGGHLAAAAATTAEQRPNAAILGYAVTEEDMAKACLPTAPGLVERVDGETCPCFLFAARTDNIVPVRNTLHFAHALEEKNVLFEMHIYAYGSHGFSVCDPTALEPGTQIPLRAGHWVSDSVAFLGDVFGEFGNGALTAPRCGRGADPDYAPVCSVGCTLERMAANPRAMTVLGPYLGKIQEMVAGQYADREDGGGGTANAELGGKMTVRDILGFGNIPEETIEEIDRTLREIPNRREVE